MKKFLMFCITSTLLLANTVNASDTKNIICVPTSMKSKSIDILFSDSKIRDIGATKFKVSKNKLEDESEVYRYLKKDYRGMSVYKNKNIYIKLKGENLNGKHIRISVVEYLKHDSVTVNFSCLISNSKEEM